MSHIISRYFDEQPGLELHYLNEIVALDGESVILDREPLHNASGREVGEEVTVSDETWELIQQAVEHAKKYNITD
jgi:hypothetical protein